MHILLSNDDGYLAPGLQCLAENLRRLGRVTVIAPDRNRSASSSSLTLHHPIRVNELCHDLLKVDGTPTDCVHLALTGLLADSPDIVVSGINHGANLGDDVWYSGTVAAAIEGRFLGFPAIAVSLVDPQEGHFDTAARVALRVIEGLRRSPLPPATILNINVPDVPYEALKGIRAVRLGARHKSEPVIQDKDPRGQPLYWIGPAGPEQDAAEDTDFFAIKQGYASITPIHIDLTKYSELKNLHDWLEDV